MTRLEERLDCRGMACPNPVLKTKEILDCGGVGKLTVLVDNAAAKENVSRFLGRFGYHVQVIEENGFFSVIGSRENGETCEVFVEEPSPMQDSKTLVLLATDRLGKGDDELGRKLAVNFLATLKEMGEELWRLVLLNGGVKLAVEGSDALASLHDLEKNGVQILVCGTCLNHFGILDRKKVGETTNMLDIVTAMQLADKVISMT